jgi:hypothetical protein
MPDPKMLYFGALGDLGHYFYSQEGGRIHDYPHPDVPWKEVDGGLCPGSVPGDHYSRSCPEVVGEALLHHKDGWTALSFWDRTIDTRPASNSNFFAEGTFTFEEMVELAKTRFPERWSRMKFEVRLAQKR